MCHHSLENWQQAADNETILQHIKYPQFILQLIPNHPNGLEE
jgi:hypothetical protein